MRRSSDAVFCSFVPPSRSEATGSPPRAILGSGGRGPLSDARCSTEAFMTILPDLLAKGLDLVIVGTAPGRTSAERGAYYAGRGNRSGVPGAAAQLTIKLT
jgi:hypothetical protein